MEGIGVKRPGGGGLNRVIMIKYVLWRRWDILTLFYYYFYLFLCTCFTPCFLPVLPEPPQNYACSWRINTYHQLVLLRICILWCCHRPAALQLATGLRSGIRASNLWDSDSQARIKLWIKRHGTSALSVMYGAVDWQYLRVKKSKKTVYYCNIVIG